MEQADFLKLKSGTDVRGRALGDNPELTEEAAAKICKAFCLWLKKIHRITEPKIAVGNDSRLSADKLKGAVVSALISCGADVVYTGLSSTPPMFILLKNSDFGCNASIMITASHLPYDKNGLKFFTADGGLSEGEIEEILNLAALDNFPAGAGKYFERPFMDEYSASLVKIVEDACGPQPLKGKKIVVDAGNGVGGFFAEKVLKPLGADTSGSQFTEPDGHFPNHIPNPEDREAIESLSKAVVANGADLGIIFDTDVDRAALVDKDGAEINRNVLIALLSAILLPKKGGVVVTDSVTSTHLTEFIESLGGKHLRYKRGYKNVIDKCRELNEEGVYSPLAIETSGHAAFPENYYLDDGAYLVCRLLPSIIAEGGIKKLLSGYINPAEEAEVRIKFNRTSTNFKAEGERVIEGLKQQVKQERDAVLSDDNNEGVRFSCGATRTLVRMSVHDPVMPINFESDICGGCKEAAEKLFQMLKGYSFLDLTALIIFIQN